MSTSRPVRCAICCPTALIRARDSAPGPVTPATLTRITLIGSAACTLEKNELFSSAGSADKVVIRFTGWLTRPPRFWLGRRSPPCSARRLAAVAGVATTGW